MTYVPRCVKTVQALQVSDDTKNIDPKKIIDISSKLGNNNQIDWDVPAGE